MLTPKRDIIVIGASAGGVTALCELIKNLPKALEASIFVVMHIGSKSYLAEILTRCGNLVAVAAENGKPYQRGCIYIAPPDYHLTIEDGMTVLSRNLRENGHRPAIDVVDVDFCVPLLEMAEVLVWLVNGAVDDEIASADGESETNEQADLAR